MSKLRWQAVVAGVGGQGVLFATRILARAAQVHAGNVLISEVHGMAQRGGSVLSHLKAGDFASPLVAAGWAELLLALEAGEAVRNLNFLAPNGKLVVNGPDLNFLSSEARTALSDYGVKPLAIPATELAHKAGAPKNANVVLLGAAAASGAVPFSYKELLSILEEASPPNRLEMNRKLFKMGGESI